MGNTFKTTILLATLTGLIVGVGYLLGGESGLVMAFAFAVLMNGGAYWFSGDIALRMAGAREVSEQEAPWLHRMVEELATYARLPKPRVAIIESPSPNAFATGRDPQHAVVAVTTGIAEILTREELMGVLGHELGHVRNRDILVSSVAATLAGVVTMVANMAQWGLMFGSYRDDEESGGSPLGMFGVLLSVILAPIAATIIQLAISRSREYGADETGAAISGDPEILARALEKLEIASHRVPLPVNPAASHLFIVNPFGGFGAHLAGLFSTHPPVQERVRRLRAMHYAPRALAA